MRPPLSLRPKYVAFLLDLAHQSEHMQTVLGRASERVADEQLASLLKHHHREERARSQLVLSDLRRLGVAEGLPERTATSGDAALRAYGGVRRIAILSPYWPVMNEAVRGYFQDMGYAVVRGIALQSPSWTGIAQITEAQCREVLRKLEGPDVDAIIQVGTNLSMVRLAAAAEMWLGKPVIAINTATYWHALRANGIKDKITGFGRLLSDF